MTLTDLIQLQTTIIRQSASSVDFHDYLPAKKAVKLFKRINIRTMRTTIKNTVIGLFTLVAILTVNFANATSIEDVVPAAELKLISHFDNQPVFQLSLNNVQNEKFFVIVRDEFGTVVYKESVSGVNIKRKYQLNTEELGTVGLTFEIVGKGNAKPVVFTVENSSRITKETLLVKK